MSLKKPMGGGGLALLGWSWPGDGCAMSPLYPPYGQVNLSANVMAVACGVWWLVSRCPVQREAGCLSQVPFFKQFSFKASTCFSGQGRQWCHVLLKRLQGSREWSYMNGAGHPFPGQPGMLLLPPFGL